jgi:hypothetical protein
MTSGLKEMRSMKSSCDEAETNIALERKIRCLAFGLSNSDWDYNQSTILALK